MPFNSIARHIKEMLHAIKQKRFITYLYAILAGHIGFVVFSIMDGNANLIFIAICAGIFLSIAGLGSSIFIGKSIAKNILIFLNVCSMVSYASFAYYVLYIALPRALGGVPHG